MKLTLYALKLATKGIGRSGFPQILEFGSNFVNSPGRSIHDFDLSKLPDFEPNLDSFVLPKGAKRTDILSASMLTWPVQFFVSERLKDLLEEFDLPPHQFFPTVIEYCGERLEDYSLLYLLPPKSYSELPKLDQSRVKDTLLGSIRRMINKNKGSLNDISLPGIPLLEDIFASSDLFCTQEMIGRSWCLFASQGLTEALKRRKCSGIEWSKSLIVAR